jgi:hypothetical protein
MEITDFPPNNTIEKFIFFRIFVWVLPNKN